MHPLVRYLTRGDNEEHRLLGRPDFAVIKAITARHRLRINALQIVRDCSKRNRVILEPLSLGEGDGCDSRVFLRAKRPVPAELPATALPDPVDQDTLDATTRDAGL